MKRQRAEEAKGFKSRLRGWNPACRVFAHFNWCLCWPGDTRRSALARPEESQGNDSGGAKCPRSLGGYEKLIAVWSPAAMLPPLPGLVVATCCARSEAKRIWILA